MFFLNVCLHGDPHALLHLFHPKPEFTVFLGRDVTQQLAALGSVFADRLAKHEAWCMVAWKGRGVASEALTTIHHEDGAYTKEASSISVHLVIPRRRREWRARG